MANVDKMENLEISGKREAEFRTASGPFPGGNSPCDYVVGLGASAGGLEALERFFDHLPPDTGMAFVVVQHLSPDFKSLMDELLARHTLIPIHRVEDGMAVEPNAIYLIPPKKEMIISGGRLLLTDKDPGQGLNLPIDIFFRSLAQDFGPRSVGIVLSGTGSDGSRGIRAIHECGGLVMAQSEETAKFDGMPKSALETGVVDFALPPELMGETLLKWTRKPLGTGLEKFKEGAAVSVDGMNAVFSLLRGECGVDFSHYKPNTVARRIERRLLMNQCSGLDEYVRQLTDDRVELNALYRDLLIGVTKFFRDREAFERLAADAVQPLVARLRDGDPLRAWVAGCATGEEAFSIAILVHEAMAEIGRSLDVKIFATDVHRASLDFASAGVYPEASLSEVGQRRLDRYFSRHASGFQVVPELRKMIVFAPHNIIRDAPFTRLDLISCRNLLIYLQPQAQKKVISLFHFGLKTGGVLFLGPSESPAEVLDEFEPVDGHWKIYRKRRDIRLPAELRLPLSPGGAHVRGALVHAAPPGLPDLRLVRAYDALLDEYVPPSLLINERREVLHVFSGAGKWLTPPDGRPSNDLLDMVDRALKPALAGAIHRAVKEGKPVIYTGVSLPAAEGGGQFKLTVRPVAAGEADPPCLLISLETMSQAPLAVAPSEEVDIGRVSREQLQTLEAELRYTKENLQATVEELETSNEELQATNEELVASNEELQSTNEELHSVNEELYTVNAEYQRKIAELTELTDDMDNLLQCTDVGTVFLDHDLCIRKFTPQVARIFRILPQDVGRPIDSFTHHLQHDGLLNDLAAVLKSGTRIEKEVCDRQGTWFLLRILPYQSKGRVEGVVLTLVDISLLKRAEKDLRLMSKVFMDGADPVVIEDLSGRVLDMNSEAEHAYGWKREELLGRSIEILLPEESRATSRQLRERCLKSEHVRNVECWRRSKSGDVRPILLTMSLLTDEHQQPVAIATLAKDITALKQAEEDRRRYALQLEQSNRALRETVAKLERAESEAREGVRLRDHFLAMLSHELRNPLGAVLSAAYVMEREPDDVPRRAAAYAVVRRQAQQMARLLDDLLDVSRITQNKIEIRKEVMDLAVTTDDAVQAVEPLARARGQEVTVQVESRPIFVLGDAARLQQMQVNLLNNAVKYTPDGGRIHLSLAREGNEAVVRVRDSGRGIAPEMLERIFDLFVQEANGLDRRDGGMGVGLTLVRSLAQLHGGSVVAHSDGPGCGSEFVVRIPLAAQPPAPGPGPEQDAPALCSAKVLVIEDNADSREMLKQLLELDGCRVVGTGDGLMGLKAISEGGFDVALIDIGLPGMDGYEVARQARAALGSRCPYLVALTGYGQPSDRQAVIEAGFDEHIVKPLKAESLHRVIGRPHVSGNPSTAPQGPPAARKGPPGE